jgi:hypothetical protein
VVIGIADSSLEVTITQDTTISGRLYVQSTGFASIIDRNLQIGNGALTSGAGRLIVDGNTTASTGLAQQGYISGALIAAANSDSLYGLNVAPAFTPGAFTGVTQYGVKIGDVAGGATNYALHTGTGSVLFGGLVTGSAGFSGALNGTVGATTPASVAATDLSASSTLKAPAAAPGSPADGHIWADGAGAYARLGGVTRQLSTVTFSADIASAVSGIVLSSQVVLRFVAPRAITLADDFAESLADADVAATAETVLTVAVNGSSVGTITIAASGTSGTFATTGGAVSLVAGDVVTVTGPATADATLAGLAITFAGSASATSGSYDVGGSWDGPPGVSDVVLRFVAVRGLVITDESQLYAGDAATAETVFDVQVGGVSVGSITVAAAGDTGTFALTGGATAIATGEVVTVVAPASPDATLADIAISLKGTEVAA